MGAAMERSYFEQAADALRRAMRASDNGEQALFMEEALRLNRLGLAEQRARLAKIAVKPPPASPPRDGPAAHPPSPAEKNIL
jgi:hypothetical protein